MSIMIDTCTWLDIGTQVSAYNRFLRLTGGRALTVSEFVNKLFGKSHEFFVCDMIRKEIDSYFIRKNYNPVFIDSRTEYALRTQITEQIDTVIPDNLKQFLNDNPQSRSQDREIFLSGKGEDIEIIVTQNRHDFSKLHKRYYRFYNPEIIRCVKGEMNLFSGTETFSPRIPIQESLAGRILRKINELKFNYLLD